MRFLQLFLALVLLSFHAAWSAEQKVLTPAEATKQERRHTTVTVEFVVKLCHPVLPDGKHFRLFSTRSFKDKDAFAVHLTSNAVAKLGIKDLEKYFLGKWVRVSGKVEKIIFSSTPERRPGIVVDDPVKIEVIDKIGKKE